MGLCAILSNVKEAIEQKPAEKENRREQRQNDKYFILFYASEAMSLDLCYSHIRADDRCAIYAHVICVSENDSIGGLQVQIHLGAKSMTFQFWRGWCYCRHIDSNAGYKTRIPLLFIIIIESIYCYVPGVTRKVFRKPKFAIWKVSKKHF